MTSEQQYEGIHLAKFHAFDCFTSQNSIKEERTGLERWLSEVKIPSADISAYKAKIPEPPGWFKRKIPFFRKSEPEETLDTKILVNLVGAAEGINALAGNQEYMLKQLSKLEESYFALRTQRQAYSVMIQKRKEPIKRFKEQQEFLDKVTERAQKTFNEAELGTFVTETYGNPNCTFGTYLKDELKDGRITPSQWSKEIRCDVDEHIRPVLLEIKYLQEEQAKTAARVDERLKIVQAFRRQYHERLFRLAGFRTTYDRLIDRKKKYEYTAELMHHMSKNDELRELGEQMQDEMNMTMDEIDKMVSKMDASMSGLDFEKTDPSLELEQMKHNLKRLESKKISDEDEPEAASGLSIK